MDASEGKTVGPIDTLPYMGVSKNNGTPKSSILKRFSIINHPFGVPLFLETPTLVKARMKQGSCNRCGLFDSEDTHGVHNRHNSFPTQAKSKPQVPT